MDTAVQANGYSAGSRAACSGTAPYAACSHTDEGFRRDHNDRHVEPKALEIQPARDGRGRVMYRFLECTAAQYMTRSVTSVTRQVTMSELGELFEKHDFNSFPVVEDGNMLGIVTKFDFLKTFAFTTGQMLPHYDELMQRPVAEMMTEAVVHVEPTAPLTAGSAIDGEPENPQFSRHWS